MNNNELNDRNEQRYKALGILDMLKSNHWASISEALTDMDKQSYNKRSPHFIAAITWIWYKVSRSLWLDPKEVEEEYEQENNLS